MTPLICPRCGGTAFRIPRAISESINVECVRCAKVTSIDLPPSQASNVVRLVLSTREAAKP